MSLARSGHLRCSRASGPARRRDNATSPDIYRQRQPRRSIRPATPKCRPPTGARAAWRKSAWSMGGRCHIEHTLACWMSHRARCGRGRHRAQGACGGGMRRYGRNVRTPNVRRCAAIRPMAARIEHALSGVRQPPGISGVSGRSAGWDDFVRPGPARSCFTHEMTIITLALSLLVEAISCTKSVPPDALGRHFGYVRPDEAAGRAGAGQGRGGAGARRGGVGRVRRAGWAGEEGGAGASLLGSVR
jgi:hypothetical protein